MALDIFGNEENDGQMQIGRTDYDTKSSILSDITGGVIATVADFGVSVYNSLPGTEEVETQDFLEGFNQNAARVYEENTEVIQAASLIGGSFIPGGMAIKGLTALRAGAKGASWFSEAGKLARNNRLKELAEQGTSSTGLIRKIRRESYGIAVANGLTDAAVSEIAVLGTMSAHPLLEDYWEEPVTNIGLSLAFGGAIGGLAGSIVSKSEINKVVGAVESEAVNTTLGFTKRTLAPSAPALDKLKVVDYNIASLKKLTDPNYPANEATKEFAGNYLQQLEVMRKESFEGLISTDLQDLPLESRNLIMNNVLGQKQVAGIDSITFYKNDEGKSITRKSLTSKLSEVFAPKVNKTDKGEVKDVDDVVYFPGLNKFATEKEAVNFLDASASGISEAEVIARAKVNINSNAVEDFPVSVSTAPSLDVSTKYLVDLKTVDMMSEAQLKNLIVGADDYSMLNALSARAVKEPELFAGLGIKVKRTSSNFDNFEASVIGNKKLSTTYFKELDELTTANVGTNIVNEIPLLSERTGLLVKAYTEGVSKAKSIMRKGVADLNGGLNTKASAYVNEIYNSVSSKAVRESLQAKSEDGFVYLYKAAKGKNASDEALQSFTASKSAAARISQGATIYKVAVDDVIGAVNVKGNTTEFLVSQKGALSPIDINVSSSKQAFNLVKDYGTDVWDSTSINKALVEGKDSMISNMLRRGMPMEAIAIRTNTPIQSVQAYATGLTNGQSISDLSRLGEGYPLNRYNDASNVAGYLAPENRPLRLKTNTNRPTYNTTMAGANAKFQYNTNMEFMDESLLTSKSDMMQNFHKKFLGDSMSTAGIRPVLDIIRSKIGNAVNSKVGNQFFQSADQAIKDTGFGAEAAFIGKEIQAIASAATEKIVKPLSDKMALVAKDPIALVEANFASNVVASIKGPRFYENGKFLVPTDKVDAMGKTILKPFEVDGKVFEIKTKSVMDLFDEYVVAGREMFEQKNTLNRLYGKPPLRDLGFWQPPFNATGKRIGYVWNNETRTTQLIWGRTEEELATNIQAYKRTIAPEDLMSSVGKPAKVQIIESKSEQGMWNMLNDRADPLTMQIANVENFNTGSGSSAIVKSTTDIFSEHIQGYTNYVEGTTKQTAKIMLHDIVDELDKMSAFNQKGIKDQPLSLVEKAIASPKDGARTVRNVLLGNSNLNDTTTWKSYNETFETVTTWGLNGITSAVKTILAPVGGILNAKTVKSLDYEVLAAEAAKRGVAWPYAKFDEEAANIFKVSQIHEAQNTSKRAIYASNMFAATAALRVLEVAQPLVNAMSLPILTYLAKAEKHPASFMGKQLETTAKTSLPSIMYEGWRMAAAGKHSHLDKMWAEAGYFKGAVSEANDILRESRKLLPGTLPKIENALDSALVNILSTPADWTENMLRRKTMYTGYALAKRLYPELNDTGATIFARDFMDKSMGNYNSAQRPVFFQGTAGVALGLFQTYMLTLGQSMYRHLEMKNYKEIGKAAMLQSSLFGTQSLPGFDLVSNTIGDHFSDDNTDLTTGTFKMFDDPQAQAILYGLPSSLGPAFYSRGDIAPRFVPPTDPTKIAAVNLIGQTMQFGSNLAKAAGTDDATQAVAQAISLQSVSRPLARVAELFSGYSITQQGRTIATPEEVRSSTGIISRLLAVRPIEEAVAREADYLNRSYNSIERENRQVVTKKLKTAIREGTLSNEKLQEYAEDYLRKSGTSNGWRSAVNSALAETNLSGREQLVNLLKPDNPVMYMVDSLDGELE